MSLNKSKALRTAEKYALQGKIPAAIDEYRKVVSADPGDLTTVNTLGDLYVRAGRIQDAISNFSRIANSYREGGFTLKADSEGRLVVAERRRPNRGHRLHAFSGRCR